MRTDPVRGSMIIGRYKCLLPLSQGTAPRISDNHHRRLMRQHQLGINAVSATDQNA